MGQRRLRAELALPSHRHRRRLPRRRGDAAAAGAAGPVGPAGCAGGGGRRPGRGGADGALLHAGAAPLPLGAALGGGGQRAAP